MERFTWQDIIGHAECVAQLRTMIRDERTPHALLFVGPEGIGKFLVARVLAAALFCEREDKPCGNCANCKAFYSGTHPDYAVVRPDGQAIKIDQIRALQSEASLAPYLSDKRVVIIEQAEMMTPQSANCLLKTLEEPQIPAVFILIASGRQMLLETILSRCMSVPFQPLSTDALTSALIRQGISPAEAAVLAHLSEGSLGRAAAMSGGGLAIRDMAMEVVEGGANFTMEDVWRVGLAFSELDKVKLQELFLCFSMVFRDMLVLHSDKESILIYNSDLAPRLAALGAWWTRRKLIRAVEKTMEAQKMLKANVNTRLLCEWYLVEIHEI